MDRESDRGSSEAGSGRGTPRSVDNETLRSDTPGTMPTYQYSVEELYDLEKAPASRLMPDCLEKEFIVDGIWDAEKWHRSFGSSGSGSKGGSRGPSPLNAIDPRERRGEMLRRNSGSSANPKDRLKEEKDIIVLSPQRRSFGTGCHVSQQPLLQRALSNMESDRERREQRRIGSGRIQIDRERGRDQDYRSEREYRNDRGQDRGPERDSRDFRNDRHIDKDPRDFRSGRDRDLDRDRDRDFRNPRDRFDRDDRDRKFDRDRIFIRRDLDDRRDFRDHGSRYNNRRDRHDSHREEEPEWFSSGPASKSDTIELHGFERDRRDSDRQKEDKTNNVPRKKQETVKEQVQVTQEETEISDEEEKQQQESISVADRNGSLETNESSSPETNQSDLDLRPTKSVPSHIPSFDFNEFFNIDNIPGLTVPDESVADADPSSIGGSRFYQLYRTSLAGNQQTNGGSKENSRRSSLMEDEFGYLNDLLNGSKSPVLPSPPPPSANSVFERSSFLTPFASSDKQHQLEFGTVGQKFVTPNNSLVNALINNAAALERNRSSPTGMKNSPQETEAKLKALLFGRLDSASSSGNTTPGFNSPLNAQGKVKTVAELEGELQAKKSVRSATPPGRMNRESPQSGSDLTAFNKLISLMQAGAARPVESPKQPIKVEPRAPSPLSTLPSHLQQAHLHQHVIQGQQAGMSGQIQGTPQQQGLPPQMQAGPPQNIQGRVIHKPEPINLQGQQLQNQRSSVGEMPFELMDGFPGNMTTPTSVAPPPNLGLSDAAAAQKQFFEAIQRNKEQQLQIRQVAIHNMRLNQQGSSTGPQPPTSSQILASQQTPCQQPQSMSQILASQQTPGQQQQQQNNVQGRRSSSGDPVMSFLKANPTIITKPASPTPPPQQQQIPLMNFVQPGTSPRGPSPSPLQSALLSRQAQGSPRVPSPIMFSQQPPMHLSAPSPIHPAQGGSSLSQSPIGQPANTNTVNTIRPPSVPRVPSPQELIVHTQAILQNALIKKQLEDQKERFYKKQQERAKSPAIVGNKPNQEGNIGPTRTSPAPVTSTPVAAKSAVNVAFTPTSVIRKMHSEKASEKERLRRDSVDIENTERDNLLETEMDQKSQDHQAIHSQQDNPIHQGTALQSAPTASIPPPAVIHAVPPPPLPNQIDAVKSQHLRALIGQQSSNHSHGASPVVVSTALPTSGRAIVKGNVTGVAPLMTQTSVSKDHGQRPIMGGSTPVVSAVDMAKLLQRQNIRPQTSTPYPIPIAGGRMPLQTSPVVAPQPPITGANPVYIQQMVAGTSPRGYNQYPQLTSLQAQQRMIDPRTSRPLVQTSLQSQGFNPRNLNPQLNQHKNGPISPGIPVSMVTVSNSSNKDLMKWFGTDMLKTQLPTMPPLPVQGHAQRVLTLDELERT